MKGLGIPRSAKENFGCTWGTWEHYNKSGSVDDKSESTWKRWRQGWERQQKAWRHLGMPATSLVAPRITVEQSGKYNFFFGNAAGSPGNHSY